MLSIAVLKMAIRAQKHVLVECFCARWAQIARLFPSTTMSAIMISEQKCRKWHTRGLGSAPLSQPLAWCTDSREGRVVGGPAWPPRALKWSFGRGNTSSWRIFGRVELKSLGSSHRQPCPWKPETLILSGICIPGARGPGPQPPSLPGGRGPLTARGRVVGCTLWPPRSSKCSFGCQCTSSWRVFGRVELKSSDLSIDNHIREKYFWWES